MNNHDIDYENKYQDDRFWDKLTRHATSAGQMVVEKALLLYYTLQSPNVPRKTKAVIYGALGYFIWPLDAVPDVMPMAGYTDDLSVLLMAVATVALYTDATARDKARAKVTQWFGSDD